MKRPRQPGFSWTNALLCFGLALILGVAFYGIASAWFARDKAANAFDGWYEDKAGYEQAQAEQARGHKPMLVYFYADWCPHCKRLSRDILSNRSVQDFLRQTTLNVRIAPDNGPDERALMSEYGAECYPTLYVVRPDGTRMEIETHVQGDTPRLKTPQEFIRSVRAACWTHREPVSLTKTGQN